MTGSSDMMASTNSTTRPTHPFPLPIGWGEGGRRPGEGTVGDGAKAFFQCPLVWAAGVTLAMSGEKTAPVPPEQRPDPFAVRLRKLKFFQLARRKEFEPTLLVRGGRACQQPF